MGSQPVETGRTHTHTRSHSARAPSRSFPCSPRGFLPVFLEALFVRQAAQSPSILCPGSCPQLGGFNNSSPTHTPDTPQPVASCDQGWGKSPSREKKTGCLTVNHNFPGFDGSSQLAAIQLRVIHAHSPLPFTPMLQYFGRQRMNMRCPDNFEEMDTSLQY